jgi:CRISPR-associated protein Csh1
MFQKLAEYSKLLPDKEVVEYLNEGMPEIYDRGIAICFDEKGNYHSISILHKRKYVIYRSGPPGGTDYTPCCKLAKTTNKRILKAAKNLSESNELSPREKQWLDNSIQSYEQNIEHIWKEVNEQSQNAQLDGKNHRGYAFWAKIENGIIYPVYEWDSCKRNMQQSVLANWETHGGYRENGTCFVCGQNKKPVIGNFSLLACYNLDKIGSIAGGFKKTDGVKNFPVCKDCAIRISGAVINVENYLTSTMAGQSYMVLPYSNSVEVRKEMKHLLTQNPARFKLGSSKQFDLLAQEESFLEDFAEDSDQMAFALIFFKQENAAWRIQAEVQQVLPSRIKALHYAGQKISYSPDLLFYNKKGEETSVQINANLFRNFSEASEKKSEEIFRAWLIALFENKQINYRQFLHHLVGRILSIGRKESSLIPWTLRQAWAFYRYACMTHLINPKEEGVSMEDTVPESPYGQYILDHPGFFDQPEKIVAFLTGCYMSVVTSVQYGKRKSAPFAKKFVGRLLPRDHLKRLYREGHDKLSQYEALGLVAKTMDPDLAQAWVRCGADWKITDEESTFAFTIGYSLESRIRELSKNKELAEISEFVEEVEKNEPY